MYIKYILVTDGKFNICYIIYAVLYGSASAIPYSTTVPITAVYDNIYSSVYSAILMAM